MTPLLLALAAAAAHPSPPPPKAATRATASLADLITMDDYPAASLRNEEQGTVAVRLDVTPQGLVGACTVTSSSGYPNLDAATCRLFSARARFTPARDAAGRAVADSVTTRTSWRIQDAPPAPPAVQAAAETWFRCLGEAIAPNLASSQTAETLVGHAFGACVAQERELAAIASNFSRNPVPAGSEAMRAGIRAELLKQIFAARQAAR